MSVVAVSKAGPTGGLVAGRATCRRWRWQVRRGVWQTAPVRCSQESWYLVQAKPADGARTAVDVLVVFYCDDHALERRAIHLVCSSDPGAGPDAYAWLEVPQRVTHLAVVLPADAAARHLATLHLYPVSERDPVAHPAANTPRWSKLHTPQPVTRLRVPPNLAVLAEILSGLRVEVVEPPRTHAELVRAACDAAYVVQRAAAAQLGLTWAALAHLATRSHVFIDLATAADVLGRAGVQTRAIDYHEPHGLMSARVEYGDVATRGFAMQDVLPMSTLEADGGFGLRVLRNSRAWRAHATAHSVATLLSSETPWMSHRGDVVSAAMPTAGGELLLTDLPWIVAGVHGPQVAPRLAAHLLRMHLGLPLGDHLQYWLRGEGTSIIVRDIADVAQRYAPLQTVRWAAPHGHVAHLGLTLPGSPTAKRHCVFHTGRIDTAESHDGLPPEPLMIFMRWLAREQREQTAWARRHLGDLVVTWQFDVHHATKYATNFGSARALPPPTDSHAVRFAAATSSTRKAEARSLPTITLPHDEGLLGDGSLAVQDTLTKALRKAIEQAAAD